MCSLRISEENIVKVHKKQVMKMYRIDNLTLKRKEVDKCPLQKIYKNSIIVRKKTILKKKDKCPC